MKTRLDDLMPLVIFCHGFKGFKDWGCFPYMLDKIAAEGNFVVSFNFSYNGVGEEGNELTEFTRLDRFAENTFTRELEDLESVIDYLENHREKFLYDLNKIILIGHSRGGGIVILQAAKDKRVKKLITLASVSTFDRYSDRLKEDWKKKGYWEVQNSRTGQMMRMNVSILEDFERNAEALDIEKAAGKINISWLIIHGTEDISVDYSSAETLHTLCQNGNSELKLLENTGHTFGAVHPFQGTTQKLEEAILLINEFIKN
ncbi:MAG TPA: alpha/beta fold hydrolase [Ignavibacteria bacterium]|nr:alpha/beta fold hydrolase [Ignavibacteria bacterium]